MAYEVNRELQDRFLLCKSRTYPYALILDLKLVLHLGPLSLRAPGLRDSVEYGRRSTHQTVA